MVGLQLHSIPLAASTLEVERLFFLSDACTIGTAGMRTRSRELYARLADTLWVVSIVLLAAILMFLP
jgi:hypothetical protein